MSELIKDRLPIKTEAGVLPDHPAVKTPWDKLLSFRETYAYAMRHNATVAAMFMQVLRIIIPDYEERSEALCEVNLPNYKANYSIPEFQDVTRETKTVPPFVSGAYTSVVEADHGDEGLLMCGRVNDYSTYRTEKELDTCPWDIVGSEYCHCTTCFSQGMGEAWGEAVGQGLYEFNMIEARGCGDRHCRIVGEDRTKFPMPPKKNMHDNFGPIATQDLIKVTPEEDCYSIPQQFRPECNYLYHNGFNAEFTGAQLFEAMASMPLGSNNIIPTLLAKEPDQEKIFHVTKCVFEAAGKMAFSETSAIKGMRDWLGVPGDVHDGRVLGGYIEVVLQSILCDYKIAEFNKDRVVYNISLSGLQRYFELLTHAYLSMWNGMVKTLVSTEWAVWRETENVDKRTLRLVIGKKIDKFC